MVNYSFSSIFIFFLAPFLLNSKYTFFTDLNSDSTVTQWTDMVCNTNLNICQNTIQVKQVGVVQNTNNILWKRIYTLPKSSQVFVYFEYQISGTWSDYLIQVYANDILSFSKSHTLIDQSRTCSQNFQYESNVYFSINQYLDQLKLEIKVNQLNIGLFIQNFVLIQRSQVGRNYIIPLYDYIPKCTVGTGLTYAQYYCQCQDSLVYKENKCQSSCGQNYVYDSSTNTCYYKKYCSACNSNTEILQCDVGYFKLQGLDISTSECVSKCSGEYQEDSATRTCVNFAQYISAQKNNGCKKFVLYKIDPVNHYYFFSDFADFLHFFEANDFVIKVKSNPFKMKQRSFNYFDNKFVVGTLTTFQTQDVQIIQQVYNTQHKIIFRAIAHFIDFQPTTVTLYINNELQPSDQIVQSSTNLIGVSQDYEIKYDLEIKRTEFYPPTQNVIKFHVEQPLQNGEYKGYFYIDDIHIFQFECQPGCDNCFTYEYCTPCLNPDNKNPDDCKCLTGYVMKNDICIDCPTYCTNCENANICVDCKSSTLRINSPNCDTCPAGYFVETNVEDCQTCIDGCKVCSDNLSCTQCKSGFFRDQFNECQTQCIDGYFNDSSNLVDPQCTICDDNCLKCQNTSTNCTDCSEPAVLVNGHCYLCNDGTYLSGTTCISCITNCQTCTSSICQLCQETYYYNSKTNQCVELCDDGYYQNIISRTCNTCDSTCVTCSGGTLADCITCPPGKILNLYDEVIGECSGSCQSGFYKLNSLCVKCWKGCSSCLDGTKQCLTCAKNYFRLKTDSLCYDICPDGYYNNPVESVCSNCNSLCKTCNGKSEINCLSCNLPLAYYQNQCLSECFDGYGNVNGVCVECAQNCKSCFGTEPNECLKCNQGFYFLNNQCYLKCPQFYNKIRPQYICKCMYDNCVTCTSVQFYLNNVCYEVCPNGYYGYNGFCVKCDISCKTCSGTRYNECLTCNTGLCFYKQQCLPFCYGALYLDIDSNECKDCDSTCLSCTGPDPNNCTACKDEQLLSSSGECMDECPSNQYPVLYEKKCYDCDASCLTCFGSSHQNCITCPTTKYYYLSECVDSCPDGFTVNVSGTTCDPNTVIVIAQCSYQCQTCQLTARFCTKCSANRASNSPNCDCEEGFFDDQVNSECDVCSHECQTCSGSSTHCIQCLGDRLLPDCSCPQQYYDDLESVQCQKCADNCLTCNDQECILCLGDRINSPKCECPTGYYETYTLYCSECSPKCSSCIGGPLICETCSNIRQDPPACFCPDGYSEISDENEECLLCDITCIECNIDGCISCAANRVGPINGKCDCDTNGGISRLNINQIYCTDCKTGVPFFGLNEDFTGFSIDFGGQVMIIETVQNDLCEAFFEEQTLAKLGNNPICDFELNILFGENPSLKVGDDIHLKKVFIKQDCLSAFEVILVLPLSIPNNIEIESHLPDVKFKMVNELNICDELEIKFEELFFNGRQEFDIISWEQKLPVIAIIDYTSILKDAKIFQNQSLIFPAKMFKKDEKYKISITIKSFAGLQNTFVFQFSGILLSKIQFYPSLTTNQFHRFDSIFILNQISYQNCQETNPPEQILLYEIKQKNTNKQLISGNITEGLIDGFIQDIPLQFNPYYFKFENPYSFILSATLKRPDYVVNFQNSYNIYIVPSAPKLKIVGGNRMVGYTDILYLNSTILDQDLTTDEASKTSYDCFWSCQDIVNGTDCKNQANETIFFDTKCNQILQPKSFPPYSVFNFEYKIKKQQEYFSTKVSIQIIEIDLPTLSVKGPNQNSIHNYYDEFIFELIYPGINPDILMYAGAVIYDNIVQATFQFYYLEFKFKIQNFFTNFDSSLGNQAKLRLSIYDPRFLMPSLNTQILTMNLPPENCALNIQINDIFIEFLDTILVTIEQCQDINLPLFYSAMLFPNSSIYQSDLEKSNFYNYFLIAPPQQTSTFKFTLPYQNKRDSLLVFNIQDSQDGIVNITRSVKVKKLQNITEYHFRSYQDSLKSFDDILIGYNLITYRLNQMSDLNNYKVELLQQLILLDQNQSMLSNQTETLYHCVSNLLTQNVSLIQNNETLILQQVNYRIELAKEKLVYFTGLQKNNQLTSNQNVDKSNYVKQYYTFTHILSSYINYRVTNNQTATEVQDKLSKMIDYLQDISVANEPLYKVQSNSVDMNFGFLTSKLVQETTGTTLKDDNPKSLRLLEEQANNNTQLNSSTDFYKFSQTRFIDNPFYATDGFPKNSSGYQAVDPKMTKTSSTSSSSTLSSMINFKFPITKTLAENVSTKCIAKVDSGEWSAEICKSVQKNGETVCECNSVNPTSIMESLDYLMDKAAEVFSLDTLLAFASFPFYKTIVFYFYLLMTGSYAYIVYWGMKVDHVMFEKIAIEKEIQEKEQKLKDEQNKEQNQEQEQDQDQVQDQEQQKQDEIKMIDQNSKYTFKINFAESDKQQNQTVLSRNSKGRVGTPDNELDTNKGQTQIIDFKQPLEQQGQSEQQNLQMQSQCELQDQQINDQKQLDDSLTKLKAYVEYLKYFHQILQIIYKDDENKPRGLRASIIYTSIMGSLAVLFVFGQINNISLTLTLALITAPLNKIYQILLEKMLSSLKKIVRVMGAILMIVSAAGISYTMLAGLILSGSVETANQWSFIFIGTFSLDNIFYSPIQLIVQYFFHIQLINFPIILKLLNKLLDDKAKLFLKNLLDKIKDY